MKLKKALLDRLELHATLPLECDGMTRVVTFLLTQAKVPHAVKTGYVKKGTDDGIDPHFWVELPDGKIIDYRLQMWLGDAPQIPHGIFNPKDFPAVEYAGRTIALPVPMFIYVALAAPLLWKETANGK